MVLCVVFHEKVTSRIYNVERHFETSHSKLGMSTNEEEKRTFYKRKSSVLKSFLVPTNNIAAASFQVAHCIARNEKTLSEGAFVKKAFYECNLTLFIDFKDKCWILKHINELPISSQYN